MVVCINHQFDFNIPCLYFFHWLWCHIKTSTLNSICINIFTLHWYPIHLKKIHCLWECFLPSVYQKEPKNWCWLLLKPCHNVQNQVQDLVKTTLNVKLTVRKTTLNVKLTVRTSSSIRPRDQTSDFGPDGVRTAGSDSECSSYCTGHSHRTSGDRYCGCLQTNGGGEYFDTLSILILIAHYNICIHHVWYISNWLISGYIPYRKCHICSVFSHVIQTILWQLYLSLQIEWCSLILNKRYLP